MNDKSAYEKKMQSRLEQWEAEIDVLKARADKAEAGAKKAFYAKIEDLQQQRRTAEKKLDELRSRSDDAWEDLRSGIDSAWQSLGDAVRSASSRFE